MLERRHLFVSIVHTTFLICFWINSIVQVWWTLFAFRRKAKGCVDSSSCSFWDFYQNSLFMLIEDFLDSFVLALWNRKFRISKKIWKFKLFKKFMKSRKFKFSNFRVLEIYVLWYWLSKKFLYFLFTFSNLDPGLHGLRKAFVKPLFYLLSLVCALALFLECVKVHTWTHIFKANMTKK